MAQLNDTSISGDFQISGNIIAPNITLMQDKISELNNNLQHYDVPIYTDANNAMLGLTDDTTLNELVEGGIVPVNSIVKTWVNGNSAYGREIREVLNTLFHKDIYGVLTIERIGQERHLTIKSYDTLDTYSTTYTEVNGRGWYGAWLQTCGKPTHWYLNWKGLWVGIIEYQEFFFVYLRGTLTSVIEKGKYYTITSDVTSNVNSASPILFTYGNVGECVINSSGISLNLINQGLNNGTWICGQAFVYKMPA